MHRRVPHVARPDYHAPGGARPYTGGSHISCAFSKMAIGNVWCVARLRPLNFVVSRLSTKSISCNAEGPQLLMW